MLVTDEPITKAKTTNEKIHKFTIDGCFSLEANAF